MRPEGKFEHLLVKVEKLLFIADFVILDYEADRQVPIILGRLFSIVRALIDVHEGELTLQLNGQEITFYVVNRMNIPSDVENYNAIESLG